MADESSDELRSLVAELLDYFEMKEGEWPTLQVYTPDGPEWGMVGEEVSEILRSLNRIIYDDSDTE